MRRSAFEYKDQSGLTSERLGLIRSGLFALILGLILMGPALLIVAERFNVDVPTWMTSEDAEYLTGAAGSDADWSDLSWQSFATEELQSCVENELSGKVPTKAIALLSNAGLQRSAIELSNCVFGWQCYPTYYGSDRIYIPKENAVSYFAERPSKNQDEGLGAFCEGLVAFASEFPEVSFHVVVADQSRTMAANPSRTLMSRTKTTSEYFEQMRERLDGAPNVFITCSMYDSLDAFYRNYYTTDNHWNGFGIAESAKKVGLDINDLERAEKLTFDTVVFNGANSRQGLYLLNEEPIEPLFDLEDLTIAPDSHVPSILQVKDVTDIVSAMADWDFYSFWYGGIRDHMLENRAKAGERSSAVLICDSFGSGMQWPIAKHYERTNVNYDLHFRSEGAEKLADRIAESAAKDVYFVAEFNGYATCLKRHQDYFRNDTKENGKE